MLSFYLFTLYYLFRIFYVLRFLVILFLECIICYVLWDFHLSILFWIFHVFFSFGFSFFYLQLIFSILNHSSFFLLWNSAVFDGVSTHADVQTFFESTVLTSVSVHSENFTTATFRTLSISKMVRNCSSKKSLKKLFYEKVFERRILNAVFLERSKLLYKIRPPKWFSVRRSAYHLKAYECKNLRAFDFL